MNNDAIPDLVRRQWRLPASPARLGRKPTLDVDTVVAAAVQLADAEGLEGATLPRVAAELGATSMSLYRHVGSKQDLLQLMMDAASTPPSAAPTTGWRRGVQQWAFDLWELYRRRPWIPHVPLHRAPSGPNQIAWLERGLAPLAPTHLLWDEKIQAITLLSGYVRHSALIAQDLRDGRPTGQAKAQAEYEYAQALSQLVTQERFPNVAAMLASGIFGLSDGPPDDVADSDFSTGLELVLDGLQARIHAAGS